MTQMTVLTLLIVLLLAAFSTAMSDEELSNKIETRRFMGAVDGLLKMANDAMAS